MDFTGKPLKGFVYVSPLTIKTDSALKQDLEPAIVFARSLSVSAGAVPQTIAAGETSTLSGGASGGIGPYTYVWSPADSVADSASAVTVAIPIETTTYTLTVEDSNGQRRLATVQVTVAGLPGEAPSSILPPPLPSPCGLGFVGSMPFMILSCISVRRFARSPRRRSDR